MITKRTKPATEVKETSYEGWRAAALKIGDIELTVPLEFGPRILSCRFRGGENLFHQVADDKGKRGGDVWRPYGGHRLWMAPEDLASTYYPDNEPLELSHDGDTVRFTAPPERSSGLRKQITITALSERSVSVTHRFDNLGDLSLYCAPWALTVLGPGSVGLAPMPTRGTHPEYLLPTGSLTLWAYTAPDDPRLEWAERFAAVHGKAAPNAPLKVGFGYADANDAWVAAVKSGVVFAKYVDIRPGTYPDRDSSIEIFTNPSFLEIETLGTLVTLSPGKSAEHVERWSFSEYDEKAGLEGAFLACEQGRSDRSVD